MKIIEHKLCVPIFSANFVEAFLILRRILGDNDEKMHIGLYVKHSLFSSDFNET